MNPFKSGGKNKKGKNEWCLKNVETENKITNSKRERKNPPTTDTKQKKSTVVVCVCVGSWTPTWLWLTQLCHRLAYFPSRKLVHTRCGPKLVGYSHGRLHRFALRPYAIAEDILCLVPSPPICMSHAIKSFRCAEHHRIANRIEWNFEPAR